LFDEVLCAAGVNERRNPLRALRLRQRRATARRRRIQQNVIDNLHRIQQLVGGGRARARSAIKQLTPIIALVVDTQKRLQHVTAHITRTKI
jgi:hypothetical protein